MFQTRHTNRILKCDFALKLCFWENLQVKSLYWLIQFLNFSDAIIHRSRLCQGPNSKKVKLALSLEPFGIVWWNFACPLILTRSSPSDCKILFFIGQGFAEVKIAKKRIAHNFWTVMNIEIKNCIHIYIDKTQPNGFPNAMCLRSRLCQCRNSENLKLAISLEPYGIFWWNFAYLFIWQVLALGIAKYIYRSFCKDFDIDKI